MDSVFCFFFFSFIFFFANLKILVLFLCVHCHYFAVMDKRQQQQQIEKIQKLILVACFANSISKPIPSMLSAKRVWHICLLSYLSVADKEGGRKRAACFIQLSI